MKKRYNKTIAGRVTPEIRNKIRPVVLQYAKDHGINFNTVFGAVISRAENMPGHVSYARVLVLVNEETVSSYQAEMERKATARSLQIRGLIRKALPFAKRTEDIIASLCTKFANFQGSIPALKERIALEAAAA